MSTAFIVGYFWAVYPSHLFIGRVCSFYPIDDGAHWSEEYD